MPQCNNCYQIKTGKYIITAIEEETGEVFDEFVCFDCLEEYDNK